MKNILTTKRGFSLVELLVALSILAVVAAIIVPRFLNVRDAAVKTTVQAQIKTLNNAYSQWVALGGTGATNAAPGLAVDFFLRTGTTTSTTRTGTQCTSNPYRDATGDFGSANISLSGYTLTVQSTVPVLATSDGFITNAAGTNLYYKSGNMYYTITAPDMTAQQPFVLGTATTL